MEFSDLIGKTITNAIQMKLPNNDDSGFLKLTFSDNTQAIIVGDYGGYTGSSLDEYPTSIHIVNGDEEWYQDLEEYYE